MRVLPGMQAAFVDIGLEKAAFPARAPTSTRASTSCRSSTPRRRSATAETPVAAAAFAEGTPRKPDRGRRAAVRRASRPHRRPPEQGRRDPGPGGQGADRHQGRAHHVATSRCPAAISSSPDGQSPRRLAAHRGRGGAPAPPRRRARAQARRARVHRPHGLRGLEPKRELQADMRFLIEALEPHPRSAAKTSRRRASCTTTWT